MSTRLMKGTRDHIEAVRDRDELWAHLREWHRMPDTYEHRLYVPDGYGYQYREWHERMHRQEEAQS